ncbi:hypothetical protein [endosymbiont DhMRE of Dentiscutata heterogama]|nr:hypothetical protein [endosymbiont DhMRE of Dentiscutata heterogama]
MTTLQEKLIKNYTQAYYKGLVELKTNEPTPKECKKLWGEVTKEIFQQ